MHDKTVTELVIYQWPRQVDALRYWNKFDRTIPDLLQGCFNNRTILLQPCAVNFVKILL